MNDNLRDILRKFVKFGDFKLVSDKPTKVYIDIKEASTNPKILKLICNNIIKRMIADRISADYIACLELGGALIGVLLSVETELPLIIVRKEEKEYGIKGRLIGNVENLKNAGKTALFIEDVTTTGGSSIKAIYAIKEEGLIIEKVISIVDREEGADIAFSKEGIELIPLVRLSELLKA